MNLRTSHARWVATGSLLALAAIAALLVWWLNAYTRVEHTIILPPQGEAAYNPLYLLQQSLYTDQVNVESRRELQLDQFPLSPGDSVVVYGDPQQLTSPEIGRLLGWVRRGGHLVVRLPPQHGTSGPVRTGGALLERLGIHLVPDSTRICHQIGMPDGLPEVSYCTNTHFVLDDPIPDAALSTPDAGLAFTRLSFGHGVLDVWSHLQFLDNTQLRHPGHAVLARQLLAPNYADGTIHLIYGARMPPLWRLALEYGRMAWFPLLLALAAWLWLRIPRFGPLQPAPLPARRALLEHIQASGEHLYRHRRTDLLLAALRADCLRWLQRHDPLAAAQHGSPRIAAIATRTDIPAADISDALDADLQDMSAACFRQRVDTLVRMMRSKNANLAARASPDGKQTATG